MSTLLRTLRPLHWTKNLLVFAPFFLAHRAVDDAALIRVLLTFVAFCLAASGTYVLNDLRDLEFDRAHPTKRTRTIASGALSPRMAAIAAAMFVAAGLLLAWAVSVEMAWYLIGYCMLTIGYSLFLKRLVFVDVVALSALYTIRVLAGGAAARVEVSDWLLALSVFLFVALALLKRYADLGLIAGSESDAAPGRGYVSGDRDLLRSMGVASSYLAVLVLALYLTSPQVAKLYRSPRILWLVCPLLLYWVSHMWFLAHRGRIQDDPIVIAARDPVSYVVGIAIAVLTWAAV